VFIIHRVSIDSKKKKKYDTEPQTSEFPEVKLQKKGKKRTGTIDAYGSDVRYWEGRNNNTTISEQFQHQGRIQDFKLGRAHLKKLRRAEGGATIVGVFRVKNHDFAPCRTNIIMSTYEYKYNFEVSHQSP
jgi:hypothetical protein